MGAGPDRSAVLPAVVHWRGRSGRMYSLMPLRLHDFALEADGVYVLARGTLVLWAGSSAEVIEEAESRSRFRLALTCADRAFRLDATESGVERMTIVWDLEGAGPLAEVARNAA